MCCAWLLSHVWLLVTPWTVAHQTPLSMGILQARKPEWVAMPSRGSSQPRDWTQVPCTAGKFLANWATKEAQRGFPDGASDKEPACQCSRCKRCAFDPWVGKIPWRKHSNPLQYSCLEKSHGQRSLESYSPEGHKELDTTEATEHAHMQREE